MEGVLREKAAGNVSRPRYVYPRWGLVINISGFEKFTQ